MSLSTYNNYVSATTTTTTTAYPFHKILISWPAPDWQFSRRVDCCKMLYNKYSCIYAIPMERETWDVPVIDIKVSFKHSEHWSGPSAWVALRRMVLTRLWYSESSWIRGTSCSYSVTCSFLRYVFCSYSICEYYSVPEKKFSILGGHIIGHSKQNKKCICTRVLFETVPEIELFHCTVLYCTLYKQATRHILTPIAKCTDVDGGIFETVSY
jgi:hypothetical protein